jgi:hypothetical protein
MNNSNEFKEKSKEINELIDLLIKYEYQLFKNYENNNNNNNLKKRKLNEGNEQYFSTEYLNLKNNIQNLSKIIHQKIDNL